MVLTPPKEQVDVMKMMIYAIIPLAWVYVGWRIQKFWVLAGINLLFIIVLGQLIQDSLPDLYGLSVSMVLGGIVTLFVVRYFANSYNRGITSDVVPTELPSQ